MKGKAVISLSESHLRDGGRKLLEKQPDTIHSMKVLAGGLENSRREVEIVKADQAWYWYREMLHHYAVRTLVNILLEDKEAVRASPRNKFRFHERGNMINVDGQIIQTSQLDRKIGVYAQRVSERVD